MKRSERAKQFMPFAALKGYEEALRKKEHKVVNMEDTESYKNDLFGLKTLNEAGKITKFWLDERHCWYSYADIDIYIIPFVLANS